jgi:hypothetical protein
MSKMPLVRTIWTGVSERRGKKYISGVEEVYYTFVATLTHDRLARNMGIVYQLAKHFRATSEDCERGDWYKERSGPTSDRTNVYR